MSDSVFFPVGATTLLAATTSAVAANVRANTSNPNGQFLVVKIDNTNNANIDAFINFGTANTVAATIGNATATGNGICVQHGSTAFVQVQTVNNPSAVIYFSGITASGTANCWITPVKIVS